MKHALGFLVPAVTTAATNTFAQQVALALITGLLGVVGVTLAAYVSSRRAERERVQVLDKKLRPRRGERRHKDADDVR